MNKLCLLFLVLFWLTINFVSAGESGDLPAEEKKNIKNKLETKIQKIEKAEEVVEEAKLEEMLKPKSTKINLPKNRLLSIFGQNFLEEVNNDRIKILNKCKPILQSGKCFKVLPDKRSAHFDNYYFYLNNNNLVNSIIAFNSKKYGDLNECENKLKEWDEYLINFDLNKKDEKKNLYNTIYTDAPQQEKIEIFGSCYEEEFRDIKSSFSLKFFKNS